MYIYIKEWYWGNNTHTRIIELPERRLYADKIVTQGNLVYVYRGGYVQECFSRSEVLRIEE